MTFKLSSDQINSISKEFPDYNAEILSGELQEVMNNSCKMLVINTDDMDEKDLQMISYYRERIREEKIVPCYIWSEHPKPLPATKWWKEFISLKHWKEHREYSAFIQDGIVDLETFCREDKKLLFILRDMNHSSGDYSLVDDLYDHGSGYKTWNNVARWIIALLDGQQNYPRDISTKQRTTQLRRVAVMNIKKEGGCNRAYREQLANAIEQDREYILNQIYMYQPDMIICCGFSSSSLIGNADLLRTGDEKYNISGVFAEKELLDYSWETFDSQYFDNHKWWYYYVNLDNRKIPLLSYCHPQTTNMSGKRGHEDLFEPLYRDMLLLREKIL